jgi:hypothetical protein
MMKRALSTLVLMAMAITAFYSCKSGYVKKSKKKIDHSSFKIIKKNISHFTEIGKIIKAVKLETTENSVMGTINSIKVDKNGNFFIGDYYSAKKVLHFKSNGTFVTSYGIIGEGPGEYKHLACFAVDDQYVYLVGQAKIIRLSKNDPFIKEKRLNFYVGDIAVIADSIYLNVVHYRGSSNRKNGFIVMDEDLNKIDSFDFFDPKNSKYKYLTFNLSTSIGHKLFYLKNYDLSVNAYNTKTGELLRLNFPNNNADLETIWEKKQFNETDRKKIRMGIHRFEMIHALENGLFLTELCRGKNIMNCWVLDFEKRTITVFPYSSLLFGSEQKLYFNMIAVSIGNSLLGVFDNSEKFNRYKENYPALKDIEFKTEDNPILAFIEFN